MDPAKTLERVLPLVGPAADGAKRGNSNVSFTMNLAAYNLGGMGHGPSNFKMLGTPLMQQLLGTWTSQCLAFVKVIVSSQRLATTIPLPNSPTMTFAFLPRICTLSGFYDCDGICNNDDDGDGVCNELEVAGCQVLWACNYNALAMTSPPNEPCTYPENDEVDCAGNSLLPQFLTQPQDATVSCNAIPPVAEVSVQVAPAAIAYYNLLPESCYDSDTQVPLDLHRICDPRKLPRELHHSEVLGNRRLQRI